jgi:hypothetical protein
LHGLAAIFEQERRERREGCEGILKGVFSRAVRFWFERGKMGRERGRFPGEKRGGGGSGRNTRHVGHAYRRERGSMRGEFFPGRIAGPLLG